MSDPVNHPSHYTFNGGVECIDAIQAAMSPDEFRGFLKGQVMKYMWRAGRKDDLSQDLSKADWYLTKLRGLKE